VRSSGEKSNARLSVFRQGGKAAADKSVEIETQAKFLKNKGLAAAG
jgi:hypothetical protein